MKEKITGFIDRIRSIDGVVACALVSRDGIIAGKYCDWEMDEVWLGVLSATILSTAESIGSTAKMKSIKSVTIRGSNTAMMVMEAGDNFLICSIIKEPSDHERIHEQIYSLAKKVGEVM